MQPADGKECDAQRFSPGNSLPTASASFRRLSPFSRDVWSLQLAAYRASLSSRAVSLFGLTFAYFVWRSGGTRYSATESESTMDVVYEGGVGGKGQNKYMREERALEWTIDVRNAVR